MPRWSESEDPLTMAAAAQTRLEQWRREHPQAPLREIEAAADQHLAGLRTHLIAQMAHRGQATTRPTCPPCGAAMQRVGWRERTVTTAQDQALTLGGPGYRCPACGAGLFPPR